MRNPFRRRNKKDKAGSGGQSSDFVVPFEFRPQGAGCPPLYPPTRNSAYLLAHLPPKVLERIFAFVCPHALDESYETCEGSASSSDSSVAHGVQARSKSYITAFASIQSTIAA
jgi:hypothetical protein